MTTAGAVADGTDMVLEFALGEERYCVAIGTVSEIVRPDDVTALPDTPAHVAGVMDLRGTTTTVVNPKLVLDTESLGGCRQVIIFDDDAGVQTGWLVDRVRRVTELGDADLDTAVDSEYVIGLVSDDEEFTIWVDPARVNGSVSNR
jgi:purine-binding chemotaxis protein CheW